MYYWDVSKLWNIIDLHERVDEGAIPWIIYIIIICDTLFQK